MQCLGLSPDERRTLLRFEALYEEWRLACGRLLDAELLAIAESLQTPNGAVSPARARHVEQARADVLEVQRRALAARDAFDG